MKRLLLCIWVLCISVLGGASMPYTSSPYSSPLSSSTKLTIAPTAPASIPMHSTSSMIGSTLGDDDDPWDAPDTPWADPDWEVEEDDPWEDDGGWEDPFPSETPPTPIGDEWILLCLVLAYALYVVIKRHRHCNDE